MRYRDIVRFKQSERRAILLFYTFIILAYLLFFWLSPKQGKMLELEDAFATLDLDTSSASFAAELTNRTLDNNPITAAGSSPAFNKYSKNEVSHPAESFDPNKTDSSQWIRLGIKPFVISNILKYQSKGGRFRTCNDLYKVYGIDSMHLQVILPLCTISTTTFTFPEREKTKEKIININTADSIEWVSLYGIGPVLSGRIIKYRDNLGGFHDINQLKEVYGIKEEWFAENKNRLTVSGSIRKINLNTTTRDELKSHYYITPKIASIIIKYRIQHDSFNQVADLRNIKVVNDSLYNILYPYLSVN